MKHKREECFGYISLPSSGKGREVSINLWKHFPTFEADCEAMEVAVEDAQTSLPSVRNRGGKLKAIILCL